MEPARRAGENQVFEHLVLVGLGLVATPTIVTFLLFTHKRSLTRVLPPAPVSSLQTAQSSSNESFLASKGLSSNPCFRSMASERSFVSRLTSGECP